MAEDALPEATVAQHDNGNDKDHNTQNARPSLQEEGEKVKEDDQHLVLHHENTGRLWYKEHRQHPVEAVHGAQGRQPIRLHRDEIYREELLSDVTIHSVQYVTVHLPQRAVRHSQLEDTSG